MYLILLIALNLPLMQQMARKIKINKYNSIWAIKIINHKQSQPNLGKNQIIIGGNIKAERDCPT